MLEVPDPEHAYGLEVSVVDVARHSCGAAAELLSRPLAALELFDMALIEAQARMQQLLLNQLRLGSDLAAHLLKASPCKVMHWARRSAEPEANSLLQGIAECQGAGAHPHHRFALGGGLGGTAGSTRPGRHSVGACGAAAVRAGHSAPRLRRADAGNAAHIRLQEVQAQV